MGKDVKLEALINCVSMIDAVYKWADAVEAAGGTTTISGVAKCHAMLNSLNSNRARAEKLIMAPARDIIAGSRP